MNLIKQILSVFKKPEVKEPSSQVEKVVNSSFDESPQSPKNEFDGFHLDKMISNLYPRQKELFDLMCACNKLQICLPTGAGKGYLMRVDLINRLSTSNNKIHVVSSHRLMLNTQHLNDIFDSLADDFGKVGFIFVGSTKYDTSKLSNNMNLNRIAKKMGLSYKEIITSTTSKKELNDLIRVHLLNGRQVVVITTYNSLWLLSNLEIDTIYCDEAHTLASPDESQFKKNFMSLNFKNSYFFTATPKDVSSNETDSFLMNNKDIFGERVGLSFRQSQELGFIVKPVVHISLPDEYDPNVNLRSISNLSKFVEDSFSAHRDYVIRKSFDSTMISPKILVKCSSVDEMWALHKELNSKITNINICAGASRESIDGGFKYYIGKEGISDKNLYLKKIQGFKDIEEVIVLHYDILSEGINVPGFTGVMFLGGVLPTIVKTLQNTGRATRLHEYDRSRLKSGEINTNDLSKWVKPYCSVIIPYWDSQSEFTKNELSKTIKELREKYDFDPAYIISLGNDLGLVGEEVTLEDLNNKKERNRGFEIIEEIKHEIEDLELKQEASKMADLEFEKFIIEKFMTNDNN